MTLCVLRYDDDILLQMQQQLQSVYFPPFAKQLIHRYLNMCIDFSSTIFILWNKSIIYKASLMEQNSLSFTPAENVVYKNLSSQLKFIQNKYNRKTVVKCQIVRQNTCSLMTAASPLSK